MGSYAGTEIIIIKRRYFNSCDISSAVYYFHEYFIGRFDVHIESVNIDLFDTFLNYLFGSIFYQHRTFYFSKICDKFIKSDFKGRNART